MTQYWENDHCNFTVKPCLSTLYKISNIKLLHCFDLEHSVFKTFEKVYIRSYLKVGLGQKDYASIKISHIVQWLVWGFECVPIGLHQVDCRHYFWRMYIFKLIQTKFEFYQILVLRPKKGIRRLALSVLRWGFKKGNIFV